MHESGALICRRAAGGKQDGNQDKATHAVSHSSWQTKRALAISTGYAAAPAPDPAERDIAAMSKPCTSSALP
jgi:hypothetical protein